MKKYLSQFYTLVLLICMTVVASCSPEAVSPDTNEFLENSKISDAHKGPVYQIYTANLSMLNDSGVSGTATLTLEGNQLTVSIEASGLTPDRLHPQHIHGFTENNRNSTCPPESADDNGDGIIDIPEGAEFYGPVLVPLQPFPTADSDGNIDFEATYTIDGDVTPIQNRAIVLHGMMMGDVYVATTPVACGQISVKPRGR